ncbi:MAG: hypothetical protein K8S87_11815 [Planctomycetes bacterium]|nr:hypothetical protein [Planctomycetota bacterium]
MISEQQKKVEKFWRWFQKNATKLYNFEENKEKLFRELTTEVVKIHKTLSFVFSPMLDGVREMTISADGVKAGFPYVRLLVENAPKIPSWKFTAFRQRTIADYSLTIGNVTLNPREIYFLYDIDFERGKVDVIFYADGVNEADSSFTSILFLLLEYSLGEFDVGTKLGYVDFRNLPFDANLEEYAHFPTLPKIIDSIFENYFS